MVFRWRANDGPFIVIFGSSIPSSTKKKQNKKKQKKNVIKFGPPPRMFTKLMPSVHGSHTSLGLAIYFIHVVHNLYKLFLIYPIVSYILSRLFEYDVINSCNRYGTCRNISMLIRFTCYYEKLKH